MMKAMREGVRIPKQVIETEIERYRRLISEFEAKGLSQHVKRLEESIAQLEEYKRQKRPNKPRMKNDIQKDIDYCLIMKHKCLTARRPVAAAVWDHKLKEYDKEYREALVGKLYIPQVEDRAEEGRGNV